MSKNEEMFKYHGYSGPCPKPIESQGNSEEAAFRKAMSKSAELWYPCGCKASAGSPKYCPEHHCPVCHKNTIEYVQGTRHLDGTELCAQAEPPSETPGTDLARWIWCRFVGIPIVEPYDKEFRLLLLKIASYANEIKQRESIERMATPVLAPRCPVCGSYKLQCRDGHSWDIPAEPAK